MLVLPALLSWAAGCGVAPRAVDPWAGWIEASGVVRAPGGAVDTSFGAAGLVEEVLVRPGDAVEVGAELARLSRTDLDLRLVEAEAALAETEAVLAGLEAGPRPEVIAVAEAEIRAADARAVAAEVRLDQTREEVSQGRKRPDELSAAESDARALREDVNVALARRDLIAAGAASADVDRARAARDAAAARRDLARSAVDRATLRSPCACTVVDVNVQPGEQTDAGPAIRLVSRGEVELALWIPVDVAAAIRPGQALRARGRDGVERTGEVRWAASALTPDPWGMGTLVLRATGSLTPATDLRLDEPMDVWLEPRAPGELPAHLPEPSVGGALPPPPDLSGALDAAPPIAAPRAPPPGARLAPVVVETTELPSLDEIRARARPTGESRFGYKPGQRVLLPEYVPPTDGVFGEGPESE